MHLGSFSKIGAPGLRLGWLRAPATLLPALAVAKQAADLHTSTLDQAAAADYLTALRPRRAHRRLCDRLPRCAGTRCSRRCRRRCRRAARGASRTAACSSGRASAGRQISRAGRPVVDTTPLLPEALHADVAFVPGHAVLRGDAGPRDDAAVVHDPYAGRDHRGHAPAGRRPRRGGACGLGRTQRGSMTGTPSRHASRTVRPTCERSPVRGAEQRQRRGRGAVAGSAGSGRPDAVRGATDHERLRRLARRGRARRSRSRSPAPARPGRRAARGDPPRPERRRGAQPPARAGRRSRRGAASVARRRRAGRSGSRRWRAPARPTAARLAPAAAAPSSPAACSE